MSLRTLAIEAVDERRPAAPHPPAFHQGEFHAQVVGGGAPPPASPRAPSTRAKPAPGSTALESLTRFFPTEVMSLYIPGVAMMQSQFKASLHAVQEFYGAAVVLTPVIVWLLFDDVMKTSGVPARDGLPLRQMTLGAVSFAAWGACMPGVFPDVQGFLSWLALAVATLLPAVNKKFGPR